jgi:hypothetical protein
MKKALALFLLAVILVPNAAFAASPWAEKETWSEQAIGKFEFGFKNLFAGWTEIFTETKSAYKEDKSVIGGFGTGVLNAILDTAGGALHLATFPITQIDIPLPQNGVQIS